VKNADSNKLHQAMLAYKTVELFQDTHIAGSELELIYLPRKNNNRQACAIYCLENKKCVAANYHKGSPEEGQCWLFHQVDKNSRFFFGEGCCELIIPAKNKLLISLVKNNLKNSDKNQA